MIVANTLFIYLIRKLNLAYNFAQQSVDSNVHLRLFKHVITSLLSLHHVKTKRASPFFVSNRRHNWFKELNKSYSSFKCANRNKSACELRKPSYLESGQYMHSHIDEILNESTKMALILQEGRLRSTFSCIRKQNNHRKYK
jgi:hypothetical protein